MKTVEGTVVKERPVRAPKRDTIIRTAPDPAEQPLAVVQQEPPTPMSMLDVAVKRGATIEELKQLMDLQDRWEKTEARKAFVVALAKFKERPPTIRKNKHVSFKTDRGQTEYEHATLDNVCDQVIAALSAVQVSHRWNIQQGDGKIKVACVLTHIAGHSEETVLEASADSSGGKNAIQAIGSTVSYLERYTLLAATGLAVKDQDDDGAGASERREEGNEKVKAPAKPAYTDDQIEKNLTAWGQLVDAGKQTADSIIVKIKSKATLTEGQEATIRKALA